MLSVFANIRVNDPQRLEHLKDSYYSIADISDNWVINIRGKLRKEAIAFLQHELGDKVILFELLDEDRGWLTNALNMMPAVKYNYVFLWNEDHINMLTPEETRRLVNETISAEIDYLHYGHYMHWRKRFNWLLESGMVRRGELLDVALVTRENFSRFFPEQKRECIISSAAIFRKEFLIKIMRRERVKLPFAVTNGIRRILALIYRIGLKFDQKKVFDYFNRKFFFYKLPRFPKQTPFELEIMQDHLYILPIRVGSPREEFLACIDDDVSDLPEMKGYQLIKRGLYPRRILISREVNPLPHMRHFKHLFLKSGEVYKDRYYINKVRTYDPLRAVIRTTGKVEISSGKENHIAHAGEYVGFYPNVPHSLTACEDISVDIYVSAQPEDPIIHPDALMLS